MVENGIVYTISLEGQKTGYYADQRDNRHFISKISSGQRVLDVCCYSGGFALNSVHGGAINVTGKSSEYLIRIVFPKKRLSIIDYLRLLNSNGNN